MYIVHILTDIYVDVRRIYVDIFTGENCRQFSLLKWTSFIGQFVYLL